MHENLGIKNIKNMVIFVLVFFFVTLIFSINDVFSLIGAIVFIYLALASMAIRCLIGAGRGPSPLQYDEAIQEIDFEEEEKVEDYEDENEDLCSGQNLSKV